MRREERVELRINLLDIAGGGRRGVELAELSVRAVGDDVRNRRLARARWAVENHIWNGSGVDDPAQKAVFSQNVRLAAYIIQCLRPKRVCQWLIHGSASF